VTSTGGDIDYKELEAEVEYYRAIFRVDDISTKIRKVLKATPQITAVIKLFVISETGVVSNASMIAAAEPFGKKLDHPDQYAKVVAWRIRKILAKHKITLISEYGIGYSISEKDLSKLKGLLK
jgi:hypothetical protein